ncbi:ParB/RepB/Spo0J family partition protein [Pelosinus propionicus]|uniref:Chromosome partitioning protein, ParB family n=1 Tax=Pelosinus propionicus DSM 13327 TaxID=1123291 RepID=A0A1I4N1N7_9FIRM|nr:ParB/RepB/Spo0J family partition protein [Pelosinus propionicus]SFM09439.1 chromosome partitioning protein, ParB family [Pelosinus propionicus DSM 13327]
MAKKGFSLTDLLNSNSKSNKELNTDATGVGNAFKVVWLSVYDLKPSEDNFYSVEDVADLKDSIELFGVQQNLIVKPIKDSNKHKVVAGHRRRMASIMLVEEGKKKFELVPCLVTSSNDIEEKMLLISTNYTTRELSDWEKVEQLSRLKELFAEYKKEHDLPGRVRELLAGALNISTTQVGRMDAINNNLAPEFKEELKKDNINISTAAELSKMPQEKQKEAYEQHKVKGETSLKDVKEKSAKKSASKKQAKATITEQERKNAENAGNYIRGILKHLIARTPTMQAEIKQCFIKLSVIEQYLPEVSNDKEGAL